MPLTSLQDLERFLLDQRLVDALSLEECRRQLGRQVGYDDFVRTLEQRSYLTSYQSQKLLKRETDGLRLGRYKLQYRNASGSFARVFRGCSVEDGQSVALKWLRQRYAEDPRAVALFRREGELGKRLQHKNIVPIYEVASDGNQHYFTMEFVEGGNFRDFIRIRKKFSPQEATQYLLDMSEGLEYALRLGLTHRDLKLSNVLLSAQGVAKLVDFGLAGQDVAQSGVESEVDRAIEYATLERGTGAPDNDPRSDLYFLGTIYYELLTGVPPYPSTKSREERRAFSRYRDVRCIREVDPSLPPAIADVVDRLMQISPYDRYQTPSAVVADLQRILSQNGDSQTAGTPEPAAAQPAQPTVICVENRKKQQDALREYLSKHGYRVLMMTDPIRALNRADSEAVAAVLLIGDVLGDDTVDVFQAAAKRSQSRKTPLILALSAKTQQYAARLSIPAHARVLSDSVTLRSIREAIADIASTSGASA